MRFGNVGASRIGARIVALAAIGTCSGGCAARSATAVRDPASIVSEPSVEQDSEPSVQFDTKGVEFGPWLRSFTAQIRREWLIPVTAMSQKGHVVITFFVEKDGLITDVNILRPSAVAAFNDSSLYALKTSSPTQPLPAAYPDDRVFFTITFFFNEKPKS